MTTDQARALLTLPEAERRVEYRRPFCDPELGLVTSVTDRWVFVRYIRHGVLQATAQATDPADLQLV